MFDYNPFRDFKEMMKKKILSEVDGRQEDIRQASDEINRAKRIARAEPFTGGDEPERSPDNAGEDPFKHHQVHHEKMMSIVNNPDSSAEELSRVSQGLEHEVYFRDKKKKKEVQDALRAHKNYNPELHSRPVSLRQIPRETLEDRARSQQRANELVNILKNLKGR